tara:strand:+ start:176 stop:403 length:228 start_codon:yes stop_codon:yes gene_type:complete
MTITSKQLSKIVRHYEENRGHVPLSDLLEIIKTGRDCGNTMVEDYGSLGKGIYIKAHGSYIPVDGDGVMFLESIT